MLKMTKIKLELITDPDMHIFFEKGIRVGISYISNSSSKANNKYLKFYDAKQEAKYTIYVDANNWNGYAMSKFLSTSGFKWIYPKQFDLNKYANNSLTECVLKTDLEYPKELHELHNNYPLALDKLEIKKTCCLSIK